MPKRKNWRKGIAHKKESINQINLSNLGKCPDIQPNLGKCPDIQPNWGKCPDNHQAMTPTDNHQALTPTDNHQALTPTDNRQSSTPTDTTLEMDVKQTRDSEDVMFRPKVTRGSYDQSNRKYGKNAGKQCVANSMSCIAHTKIKPVTTWQTADLDHVLDNGDTIYTNVQITTGSAHEYLLISELPNTLKTEECSINFTFSEPTFGLVRELPDEFKSEITMSLKDSLTRTLRESEACFLTFNQQTIAILQNQHSYYIFDSHSRDVLGMQICNGTSVLKAFESISIVEEHLQNLLTSMGIPRNAQIDFETTGVNMRVYTDLQGDTSEPDADVEISVTQEQHKEPSDHALPSDEDIVITGSSIDKMSFHPLAFSDQENICKNLGLKNCHVECSRSHGIALDEPCKVENIKGDGNCFFRAVSFAVSGTENNHLRIRRLAVKNLLSNEDKFVNYLRPGFSSVQDYTEKTKMKYSGTWATEVEILATAHLLNMDIYTYSGRSWLKFPALSDQGNLVHERAIYLTHQHSHYNVVLCVKLRSESVCSTCISTKATSTLINVDRKILCEENTNNSPIKRKKKKGYQWEKRKRNSQQAVDLNRAENLEGICRQMDEVVRTRKRIYYIETKEKSLQQKRHKYKTEDTYREKKKAVKRTKYATDPVYENNEKKRSVDKYANNPAHKNKVKAASVDKYANDLAHKNKVKAASVDKYAKDPAHKNTIKTLSVQKYATDQNHKDKIKLQSIEKYKNDASHKERVKTESQRKYQQNPSFRIDLKRRNNERRLRNKKMVNIKRLFKNEVQCGPDHVCSVCHRLLFKKQVQKCDRTNYKKTQPSTFVSNKAISDSYLHECTPDCDENCAIAETSRSSLWICYTCHRKLQSGKLPGEAACNNLALDPIPPELKCLNSLEQHLVSLHIPFMKVVSLPKGKQNAVEGPVICVPSDISKSASILPRCESEDQLIRVKLKRKLSYKHPYKYQFVSKSNVENALTFLTQNNKWYSNVEINTNWNNPFPNVEISGNDHLTESTDERNINQNEEEVSKNTETTLSENQKNLNQYQVNEDELPDLVEDESTNIESQDDGDIDNANDAVNGTVLDTCLQPVDIAQEVLDQYCEDTVCVAPAEDNNPIKILSEESNEGKAFPVLFPTGSHTYHDNREEKLTLSRYLNNRLMNADNRFAQDTSYIFHAQYRSEIQQVNSSISVAMRKGSSTADGKKITAQMLTDNDKLQDIMKADEGWRFLKQIRSTPAYWLSTQKDVFAMLRQLGVPTWFASFSSADMRWPEFVEVILRQQGDMRNACDLDWEEKCAVLRSNPVTVARMFDHRFHSLLHDVILSPADPIGKIKDYFYRVEFQQRGSPHTHCLFWVENAPKFEQQTDDDVAEFIDNYVSCELPSVEDDDELHGIVSEVQTHSYKHSNSCRKKGTTCRFNYPRPPTDETIIVRPQEVANLDEEGMQNNEVLQMTADEAKALLNNIWEALTDSGQDFQSVKHLLTHVGTTRESYQEAFHVLSKKPNVVLKRRVTDIWINPYSPHLLKCWNGNMDIQYILDAYSCVVYVVSYMSKAESEMSLLLNQTEREIKKDDNTDAKSAMRKLGTAYLHNREVSAQEAVFRICNLRLKESSRKVTFIPVGENPVKMSFPLEVLKKKSKDEDVEEDIWMTSIVERYKNRPQDKEFDEMCLASFCSEFRILYGSQAEKADKSPTTYRLQNKLGFIQRRTKSNPSVIRYPRFSSSKNPEKYFHSILQLFLPYRVDAQLKPPQFSLYEEFYSNGAVKCGDMKPVRETVDKNRSLFEKECDSIDRAREILEEGGNFEDAWAQISSETERERLECERQREHCVDSVVGEDKDCTIPDLMPTSNELNKKEINPSLITRKEAEPMLRSLNSKQSEVFYKVRQWCLEKVNGEKPEPFHIFLTGGAGVGKSTLIKSIYYEATRLLSRSMPNPDDTSVLLTAPTGVAAFNIGASTLHSAFSIRTDAGLPYQPLGEEKINTLRAKLDNLQILIIDEVSMVDHKMLAYVHGRLRQIKRTRDYSPFGKVSILAVGDFYQLPPVKGTSLLAEHPVVGLWNQCFSKVELEEVMRQKDDQDFAHLLNRLRTVKKEESLTVEDVNMLKSCETGEQPTDVLHIFATNAEVDQHNIKTLHAKDLDPVCIESKDFTRDARTGKLKHREKHHCITYNSNLPKSLTLATGARVMLTKNLDVLDGLVNGVFGTVTQISTDGTSFPTVVYVTFDKEKVGQKARQKSSNCTTNDTSVPIEPQEDVINNKGGIRRQFPLKLAWASTIHKVQGLTVEKAVVSLKKIFAPGQAYVALSRVTSIEGLVIQDFKEDKIFCNPQVEDALRKMPNLMSTLPENAIPHIQLILHNVQGLNVHIPDINHDVRFTNADFICMTETWLTPESNLPALQIQGFDLHHQARALSYDQSQEAFASLKGQMHGGVGLYARQTMDFEILSSLHQSINIEFITFLLPEMDTVVSIIYRPSSYPMSTFHQSLKKLVRKVEGIATHSIVMGDFNQDIIRTSSIQKQMTEYGYTQIVEQPTTESGTLIDHVYIRSTRAVEAEIVPTYFSIHEAVRVKF